jgi:hypothetical protein
MAGILDNDKISQILKSVADAALDEAIAQVRESNPQLGLVMQFMGLEERGQPAPKKPVKKKKKKPKKAKKATKAKKDKKVKVAEPDEVVSLVFKNGVWSEDKDSE